MILYKGIYFIVIIHSVKIQNVKQMLSANSNRMSQEFIP